MILVYHPLCFISLALLDIFVIRKHFVIEQFVIN